MRSLFFLTTLVFLGTCSSTQANKDAGQPIGTISYRLVADRAFRQVNFAYLDKYGHSKLVKNLSQDTTFSIGKVPEGFIASASATGLSALDSTATLIIQILFNNQLVEGDTVSGTNPSLAASYMVKKPEKP